MRSGSSWDEVENEDDDDDDVADGELDYRSENFRRHRVRILPADPPDVELGSTVDQTVDVRDANDQQ